MKKTSILVLILVLLLVPMLSLFSCDESRYYQTLVGEIAYVKTDAQHTVYIVPHGHEDGGLWIPMIVTSETETASEFNEDISKMAELAIGNTVEVVYSTKNSKNNHILVGDNKLISLKVIESAVGVEKQKIEFKLNTRYEYTHEAKIARKDWGTVVHVAKISEPTGGYFIYVDKNRYEDYDSLTIYWIDEDAMHEKNGGVLINEEMISLIESRASGYFVEITGYELYRFDDVSIQSVGSIGLAEPIDWPPAN